MNTLVAAEPLSEKARAALERYRLEALAAPSGAAYEEAYAALWTEFGERGELERREVIERWLAEPSRRVDGSEHRYHLVVARDQAGALAGVRDCHTVLTVPGRGADAIAVVYLAHVLVMPPHRRTGLAELLRAVPAALGRQALAEHGTGGELLLAAEMEPADRAAPDSLIRLVAYGRAGFSALHPAVLPYCQPDFRDPALIGDRPEPLPLLAVVRWVDHDRATTLPAGLAAAFVEHLYAVFATHCRPEHLEGPRRHALDTLAASGLNAVPLLPLPVDLDDERALAPLYRDAMLPHHLASDR